MVETALAASIPVLIGFLAALLGVGGLANKIRSVFQKVARPVNRVIDKLIDRIAAAGRKLWNRIKPKSRPGRNPAEGGPGKGDASREQRAISDANRLLGRRPPREAVSEKLPGISRRHGVPLHLVVESRDAHGERVHVQTMSSDSVNLPPGRHPHLQKLDELIGRERTDNLCRSLTESRVIALAEAVGPYGVRTLASGVSDADVADLVVNLDAGVMPNLLKGRKAVEGSQIKRMVDKFGARAVNILALPLGGRKLLELTDMILFPPDKFEPSKRPAVTSPRGDVARNLPRLEGRHLDDIEADLISAGMTGPTAVRGQRVWTHSDGSVVRLKVGSEALQGVRTTPHLVREISETPHSFGRNDIIAKVTEDGNLVAAGPRMAEDVIYVQWFKGYANRLPDSTEKSILDQIWADAGHVNIRT
jgi:hypothetical protein